LECAPLLRRLDLEAARGDRALQRLFAVPIHAVYWRLRAVRVEVEDMRRWRSVEVLARDPTFAGCYYLLSLALT
jgi:hypothetical protein